MKNDDDVDYTCGGVHPDRRQVRELFCRTCGIWIKGIHRGDATNEGLIAILRKIKPPEEEE